MGYPLSLLLAGIMFSISALHFYWCFGGKWGLDKALPSSETGEVLLKVGPMTCFVAASVFLGCAYFYFGIAGQHFIVVPDDYKMPSYFSIGALVLAIGFIIRAIGDFKYVGFFKSVRNTNFGRLDSKYFSPLCLLLGLGSLALYLLT